MLISQATVSIPTCITAAATFSPRYILCNAGTTNDYVRLPCGKRLKH